MENAFSDSFQSLLDYFDKFGSDRRLPKILIYIHLIIRPLN